MTSKKIKTTSMEEERLVARTTSGLAAALTVSLLYAGKKHVPVKWVDMSVSGAKIIVPRNGDEGFRVGQSVTICLTLRGESYLVVTRTVWVLVGEEELNVGLEFVGGIAKICHADPELWEYLNRRRSFRIAPKRGDVVRVLVGGEGGAAMGTMLDISATGLGILIPRVFANRDFIKSGLGCKFRIALKLDEDIPKLNMIARAERSAPRGAGIQWGLVFLEEDDREMASELAIVTDYIMLRQRESRQGTGEEPEEDLG
ncbi:MAG: hypothetical protein ACI8X5_002658 [Planctomycetota bacterium]|jgi:hypothetical protein